MSEQHVDYEDRDGNQARIAYTRAGQGAPVVLIHGVGLQGAIWQPQVEVLKSNHDVIVVDMPGHGNSSLPPANAGLAHYADAVLALLDALRIGRAHVIGHSMGALVAMEFALAHPDRVASLVALNAVFCRTPEQRAAIEARVAALDDSLVRPDWSGTVTRWFGEPVPASLQDAAARTRALLSEIDPVGYGRTYRLFARSDAEHRDRLPELAVPALFVTGEHDPNSTPLMSQAMARIAPRGRSIILPGQRHMMALTDPDCINRVLREFIDQAHRTGSPEPAKPIDPRAFRKALGSFLAAVIVLVCIAKTASGCAAVSAAAHLSVLAEQPAPVSMLFASNAADTFAQSVWQRGPAGSPIIDGAAAWFDCRRHEGVDAVDDSTK